MNLFQKDMSLFQNEMMKNRQSHETLKEQIEKKESEKINLNLEIYDNESKIVDYKEMINKRLTFNKKIKNLKLINFIIKLFLLFVGVGAVCLSFTSFLYLLIGIPVLGSLEILNEKLCNKKINLLRKKRDAKSNKKSVKELNEILDWLNQELVIKKNMLQKVQDDLDLLNNNLNKIELESSKIYDSYRFVLNAYQDVLDSIDSDLLDDEKDEIINKGHAEMMPVMVKKLFDRKNV